MALVDLVASRLSKPAGRVLDTPIREVVHELLREAGYASPADVQALRDGIRDLQAELGRVSARSNELVGMLAEARRDADPRVAGLSAAMTELEARLGSRIADLEARVGVVASGGGAAGDARLVVLEERVAAFPSMVESRLATIEARLTTIPAQLENRIEDLLEGARAEVPVVETGVSEAGAEGAASEGTSEGVEVRPDCKVPGCNALVRSKGFCSAHYQQWRRGTLKSFVTAEGTVHVNEKTHSVGKKYAGLLFVEVEGGLEVGGEVLPL